LKVVGIGGVILEFIRDLEGRLDSLEADADDFGLAVARRRESLAVEGLEQPHVGQPALQPLGLLHRLQGVFVGRILLGLLLLLLSS